MVSKRGSFFVLTGLPPLDRTKRRLNLPFNLNDVILQSLHNPLFNPSYTIIPKSNPPKCVPCAIPPELPLTNIPTVPKTLHPNNNVSICCAGNRMGINRTTNASSFPGCNFASSARSDNVTPDNPTQDAPRGLTSRKKALAVIADRVQKDRRDMKLEFKVGRTAFPNRWKAYRFMAR